MSGSRPQSRSTAAAPDVCGCFGNGFLAVDLGGLHVPLDGAADINAATASSFGLEPGNTYDIVVFHAERMKEGSSFRLRLSGLELP